MKVLTLVAFELEFVYGQWPHNEQYQNLSGFISMGGSIKPYLHLMREECQFSLNTVPLGAQFAVGDSWLSDQLLEVIAQIFAGFSLLVQETQ